MKTPRTDAFDPKAAKLSSPLDTMPEILPARRQQSPLEGTPQSSSIDRSAHQSINQSTKRSTLASSTRVLEKPRGFYITERLDKRLDEAVRYFKEEHGIKKVDRSIILTAMLDDEANWSEESLDLLVDRVINQLTNRLTGK